MKKVTIMNDKDTLRKLYDVFMSDESMCTSCELRMMILDAIEELLVEE